MEMRHLGRQGLAVSAIGLGCMSLTGSYGGSIDEAEAIDLVRHAVDLGVTLFDTAELYGPFRNEILLGKALKESRDRVTIATKFGFIVPKHGMRPEGVDSRPDHIRAVCDASLVRLGIDTIDLFYQHRPDPAVPMEDVAGTIADLVRAGKVRYFGLSEAGVDDIRRAHATHPVTALQSEYSLWTRDPEKHVLPLCRELGIGFVPYSPLGRGFLAGAANTIAETDFRWNMPRWKGEALSRNLGLVETLSALAQERGHTSAQIALAWLLHQGDDIVPIPGTSNLQRLEENLAAAAIRLSPEELAAIEAAIPEAAVAGER